MVSRPLYEIVWGDPDAKSFWAFSRHLSFSTATPLFQWTDPFKSTNLSSSEWSGKSNTGT
jgi:hypothetical protein